MVLISFSRFELRTTMEFMVQYLLDGPELIGNAIVKSMDYVLEKAYHKSRKYNEKKFFKILRNKLRKKYGMEVIE